ncbi:hypothetical protein P0D91_01415 [Pseudomonas sp. CBSPBW29]|nr:hypothetical protein P0D91_01415 [Pseudomonas sp. CBSPBW29]
MGVCSVHPSAGLSTGDYEEAVVKRALCHAAAETIVLATSEKLNTASPYQVVELAQVSAIVALASTPQALLQPYEAQGLTLYLA